MESVVKILAIIMTSGAFGGLIFGLFTQSTYKVRVPFSGKLLEVGFVGDMIVGVGAAISIFFVAGPLFNLKFNIEMDAQAYLQIIALGIISGFTGIRLLSSMSDKLLERISEIDERIEHVEKYDEISELLSQADYLQQINPESSLIFYDKSLKIDPENESVLIGKAKSLKRLNRFKEAITILTQVIENNPNAERAYYNRACYKALSPQFDKNEVFVDLRKAISILNVEGFAYSDPDFKSLYDDPEFQKIVGSKKI